jgi:GxxExxY protein
MQTQREPGRGYDLTGKIIGMAMRVHSTLGPGFLESVYQNALVYELHRAGHCAQTEQKVTVHYADCEVGLFVADILVDETVIVEIKSVQKLLQAHEVQLVNYLTATRLNEGLLLNFGGASLQYKKKFRLPKKVDFNSVNFVNSV